MTKKSIPELSTDADTIVADSDHPAARHKSACLVVIRGARLGTRILLDNAQLTIGRDNDCDFQISERNVSRAHCRVTRHNNIYWLEDLDSTNHTFLNGDAIDRSPLADGDQVHIGKTVVKFIDVGNIEVDYHSELQEHAMRDALTGLFNRRHLIGVLEHEIRKGRTNTAQSLALGILDIDHFKQINDELGHLAGDSALKQLTAIFFDNIASRELLARIGGEEFALVMPDTDADDARIRLDRIREAVAEYRFDLEGHARNLTISAGLAAWSDEMENTSDLLRAADQRLYRAKSEGRNRVC